MASIDELISDSSFLQLTQRINAASDSSSAGLVPVFVSFSVVSIVGISAV